MCFCDNKKFFMVLSFVSDFIRAVSSAYNKETYKLVETIKFDFFLQETLSLIDELKGGQGLPEHQNVYYSKALKLKIKVERLVYKELFTFKPT